MPKILVADDEMDLEVLIKQKFPYSILYIYNTHTRTRDRQDSEVMCGNAIYY